MKLRTILLTLALGLPSALWADGNHKITVQRNSDFTGRGNAGETILTLKIAPDGVCPLGVLSFSTEVSSVKDVTAWHLTSSEAGLVDRTFRRGEPVEVNLSGKSIDAPVEITLSADIAPKAGEGNRVTASLEEAMLEDGTRIEVEQPSEGGREILLCRKVLYSPGDYNSKNWRIPALLCLPDGSLLAVNDKRKYNEVDLPHDIDIVACRSTDKGRTWSEPVTIIEGKGYKKGYGDPALALTADGKEVVCVFVGLNGLWQSSPEDPQNSYVVRTTDGGKTWSEAQDITSLLWGDKAEREECRAYTHSFFGSGNGLTLTRGKYAGRILFAAAMGADYKLNNHAVYSDDNGRTWHVSEMAFKDGDEAKMVELTDGRVLMSVRRSGDRGYAISEDGGATWKEQGLWKEIHTNACNGDMIRYSATDMKGRRGGRNLLLHSIPNDMKRRNVSIFLSEDEGRSWHSPKTLCAGASVYSSLTVLKDGTIGIYVEENPTEAGCALWYMNFSLDWLLKK